MTDRSHSIPPIVKELYLPVSASRAFIHFVENIHLWWPTQTHSINPDEVATVVLEGNIGGRLYELLKNGTIQTWGEITHYEEGKHVAFTWALNGPKEDATLVDTRFTALDEKHCKMTLTHSGWENRSDGVTWRENYQGGWDIVLENYQEAL